MTKCIVQKRLPSAARPALLRHIAPQASSSELPGLPKPLPMGEVALRSNDGEGKPFTIKPLRSDGQALCQSDTIVALPILCQHPCPLRRSAPMPGCGSQRLLRCRLHPAGRGPNSSSLFPPLAAVVAVAPKGRALTKKRQTRICLFFHALIALLSPSFSA